MSWFNRFKKTLNNIQQQITETGKEMKDEVDENVNHFFGKSTTTDQSFEKLFVSNPLPDHWKGREDLIRKYIFDLSLVEENFLAGYPKEDFKFSLDENLEKAMLHLKIDPKIEKMRFKLVPKFIKEEVFFANYFFRLENIVNCKNEVEMKEFLDKWNVVEVNSKYGKFLKLQEKKKLAEEQEKIVKGVKTQQKVEKKIEKTKLKEKKDLEKAKEKEEKRKRKKGSDDVVKKVITQPKDIELHIKLGFENLSLLKNVLKVLENQENETKYNENVRLLEEIAQTATRHKKELGDCLMIIEDDELMRKGLQLNNELQAYLTQYLKFCMKNQKKEQEENGEGVDQLNDIQKWREELKKELGLNDDTLEDDGKNKEEEVDEKDDEEDRVMPWEES